MSFSYLSAQQYQISGIIKDFANSELLGFANITLLKNDSTHIKGTICNANGSFVLDKLSPGNYLLYASFLGYDPKYIEINNLSAKISLGEIALHSSSYALDNITVTADQDIIKADRRIIIPSSVQINTSSNAVDLLQKIMLPRIRVNTFNNEITISGGGEVQLRINGVLATMNEINTLRAEDIIRIEYHDNPGLRYGNAEAVIDYITRIKVSGGNIYTNLRNGVFSGVGWGENGLAAKFNYKKSEFSVNVNQSHRKIKWTRENIETFVFPDKTIKRIETGEPTNFKNDYINASLNYSLVAPDKYFLNIRFRNVFDHSPNEFTDRRSTITDLENSDPLHLYDHSTSKQNIPSLDIYFQRHLGKGQLIVFNAVGTYINSRNTRVYQESRNNIPATDIYSNIEGDKYSLIAEGIYEKKWDTSKFSAGLKHTQSYIENNYSGNISAEIDMRQTDSYGFAEYQSSRGKFNYTLGFSIARSYYRQGDLKREKYYLRPTLRLTYNINDYVYLRYYAHTSTYQPSLSSLNAVEQDIDSLQIKRGNPNLKNVRFYRQTLSAGYNKGIVGLDFFLQYNYDHKPELDITFLENGKFIHTTGNQKSKHYLRSELSIKVQPIKDRLTLSFTPGISRYINKGDEYTHTFTNWYCRGGLSANYKNWVFEGQVMTYNKWLSGETISSGEKIDMFTVGYVKPGYSVMIGVFGVFMSDYKQNEKSLSQLTPKISNMKANLLPMFTVNVSFNLNFGRQYKAGNRMLNNDDNDSGIMSGTKQ